MAVLIHLEPQTLMLFSLHFSWLWANLLRFLETGKLVDSHCSLEDILGLRPPVWEPWIWGVGEQERPLGLRHG